MSTVTHAQFNADRGGWGHFLGPVISHKRIISYTIKFIFCQGVCTSFVYLLLFIIQLYQVIDDIAEGFFLQGIFLSLFRCTNEYICLKFP